MNKSQIVSHIEQTRDYLLNNYFSDLNLVGLFLYGSQNYGLDIESSDIDLIAVTIPSWEDLVTLKPPISTTINVPGGGICVVKDIRIMRDMFLKQNINFIETLFTKYYWINPKYFEIYQKYFLNNAERIARYFPWKSLFSTLKQAAHKQEATPKRICNTMRFLYFSEAYSKNLPYVKCIYPEGDVAEKLKQVRMLDENNPNLKNLYAAVLKKVDEALERLNAMPISAKNHRDREVEDVTALGVSKILKRTFLEEGVF